MQIEKFRFRFQFKTVLLGLIFFLFIHGLFAQRTDTLDLWTEISEFPIDADTNIQKYKQFREIRFAWLVRIPMVNIQRIKEAPYIRIQLTEINTDTARNVVFAKDSTDIYGLWYGRVINTGNHISLNKLKTTGILYGDIRVGSIYGDYRIRHKVEDYYYLFRVEPNTKTSLDKHIYSPYITPSEKKNLNLDSNTRSRQSIKKVLRIYIAYTEDARSDLLSTPTSFHSMYYDYIFNTIIKTLQDVYNNSSIEIDVQLACSRLTSQTESGDIENDLYNFRSLTETFKFRDAYSADICALIEKWDVDPPGVSFQLQQRTGNENDAFFVCDRFAAYDQLTFCHETGHLFGAQHESDLNVNFLFNYGHGHVMNFPSGPIKTIMQINPVNAPRSFQYSNPDINILYSGVWVSTGKCGLNNNARLINETAPYVSTYRMTLPNQSLDSSHSLKEDEYGEAIASKTITLKPGFSAVEKSIFIARIVKGDNTLPPPPPPPIEQNSSFQDKAFLDNNNDKAWVYIYPNPFTTGISIETSFKQFTASIYSIYGIKLFEGNYLGDYNEIKLGTLPPGSYILHLISPQETITRKIIKSN